MATPGKSYYNPTTKQVRRYTEGYLQANPAAGVMSGQFSEGLPDERQAGTYRYYTDDQAEAATTEKPKDEVAEYYKGLDTADPTEDDKAMARESRLKEVQSEIDAINTYYNTLVADETVRQDEAANKSAGRVRALNVGAGLAGSPDASARATEDERNSADVKKRAIQVLQAEQAKTVAAIRGQARGRADEDVKDKALQATKNRDEYVAYLEKRGEERKTTARSNLVALAKSKGRSQLTEDEWGQLAADAGLDPFEAEVMYNSNVPKAEQIDYKFEIVEDSSGKKQILAYGKDPVTGEIVTKTYDSGITGGKKPTIINGVPYTEERDADGNLSYKRVPGTPNKGGGGSGGGTIPTGNGNVTLTPEEKKNAAALGIDKWTPEAQNVILNGLTSAERRKFVDDWNSKQVESGTSIDPMVYIDEWATEQEKLK